MRHDLDYGDTLDRLVGERPDVAWFVDPPQERVYSINDNPNTCRRVAGWLFKAIVFTLVVVALSAPLVGAIFHTGG